MPAAYVIALSRVPENEYKGLDGLGPQARMDISATPI